MWLSDVFEGPDASIFWINLFIGSPEILLLKVTCKKTRYSRSELRNSANNIGLTMPIEKGAFGR